MRLFSRIEWIILQTSKSWGAAAKRYASAIRVSSPVFFLGNTATTDKSAPKTPMASSVFLTCKTRLRFFPCMDYRQNEMKTLIVFINPPPLVEDPKGFYLYKTHGYPLDVSGGVKMHQNRRDKNVWVF